MPVLRLFESYVDDMGVGSQDLSEHLGHIRRFLEIMRRVGMIRAILLPVYKSFEALILSVRHGAVNVAVLTIYRPPPSATDEFFY